MKKSVLITIFFIPIFLFSQRIDNLVSFRDVQTDNYLRFSYDNDLFSFLDKDYTQGINFELVSPHFKKNPINFLFIKKKNSNKKYGLSFEHNCFTPQNIQSDLIQFNDRPFAATLVLKNFMISSDTVKQVRICSFMNFGFIGPLAFGNEMQTTIHKFTKNPIPRGWKNQISNDFVLSYGLSHEKQLFRYRNLFSVQSNANLQLGTLNTNASLGINATLGLINSPFTSGINNKPKLYLYYQSLINGIAYDATLQGDLFNKNSPYFINSKSIKHIAFQQNFGIVLQIRNIYFEFGQSLISKEFEEVGNAKWGGFKIGIQI